MTKNRSMYLSNSNIKKKTKVEKEQDILKLIDNNKYMTEGNKINKPDSQSVFNSIKKSLENHLQNERKIQKTIETQIKKITMKENNLVAIFLNTLQKYLIENKFEFSEDSNFFDLIDINILDEFHINNIIAALFKNREFTRYIVENLKGVNIKSYKGNVNK